MDTKEGWRRRIVGRGGMGRWEGSPHIVVVQDVRGSAMHHASLLYPARSCSAATAWGTSSRVLSTRPWPWPCKVASPPSAGLSVCNSVPTRVRGSDSVAECGTASLLLFVASTRRHIKAPRQLSGGKGTLRRLWTISHLKCYAQSDQAWSRMRRSSRDAEGGHRCMHVSEYGYDMTHRCHCERLRGFSMGGGWFYYFC